MKIEAVSQDTAGKATKRKATDALHDASGGVDSSVTGTPLTTFSTITPSRSTSTSSSSSSSSPYSPQLPDGDDDYAISKKRSLITHGNGDMAPASLPMYPYPVWMNVDPAFGSSSASPPYYHTTAQLAAHANVVHNSMFQTSAPGSVPDTSTTTTVVATSETCIGGSSSPTAETAANNQTLLLQTSNQTPLLANHRLLV